MNILFLDMNIMYHNPTRNNLLNLLFKVSDNVDYFGPGFNSKYILKGGLYKFIKNKNYDFIITTEHIANFDINIRNKEVFFESYKKNYYFNFDIENSLEILYEMNNFFLHYNKNKILFLLETDYYSLKEKYYKRLCELAEKGNCYFIGNNKKFIVKISEMENIKKEKYYDKATDYYYSFVNKYNKKIISSFHFITDDEIYYGNLEKRKYDVVIPGVNYWARKTAHINILNNCSRQIQYKKTNYLKVFISILRKFKLEFNNKYLGIKLYNSIFQYNLRNSKIVYTCGGGDKLAIRKFFEIPAAGGVLIGDFFKKAEEVGFIDGKNCFYVKPNNICDFLKKYNNKRDFLEMIAYKGRKMIIKKHSITSRAYQIGKSLEYIEKNQFIGSDWRDGNFYIITKQGDIIVNK